MIQMDMYLQNLLERMADRSDAMIDLSGGGKQSNPNAIFRKASEEAKSLKNLEYVHFLKDYLEKSKNEDLKLNAYKILINIYSNTGEKKIIEYFIGRLAIEKKPWTLHFMMGDIEYLKNKLPKETNIDNILVLTTHTKHVIRDAAINCLKRTDNPKAEDQLIEIISSSSDPFQLVYANSTLGNIGTSKSIPFLLKLVDHKKQDVASSALNAILNLSDKNYLELFIDQLKKGKLKYIGMEGVVKFGGINEIPIVENRIIELVAKKRTIHFILSRNETELTVGMNFLATYSKEFESVKNLYHTLLTNKKELLWDEELEWLKTNKKRFE